MLKLLRPFSVSAAVMGFDPMTPGGTLPFDDSANTLELAETARLGTRDLARIEVAGTPIREARFDFAPLLRSRYRRNTPPFRPGTDS